MLQFFAPPLVDGPIFTLISQQGFILRIQNQTVYKYRCKVASTCRKLHFILPALIAKVGIVTGTFYWDILTVSSKFDGGLSFKAF